MDVRYQAEAPTGDPPDGQPVMEHAASESDAAATGPHEAGLLVRFDGPEPWWGRFAGGRGGYTGVARLWESDEFLVVNRGQGYVVDAAARQVLQTFGGFVEWVLVVPHLDLLIFHNGLWIEGLFSSGLAWQTRRLAAGMRALGLDGDSLVGEAFDPATHAWSRFSVDLSTGEVEGGSYGRAAG